MKRPPLHIYFLAHPKSAQGRILAEQLMERFVEPPATGGLRIPVFFTPDRDDGLPPRLTGRDALDLEAADHSIVVVLTDARMAQRVGPLATAQPWQQFIEEIITQAPLGQSPHHVLPVALDAHGFTLCEGRHVLPVLPAAPEDPQNTERRLAEVSLHVAARAIQLLEFGTIPAVAPQQLKAPVRLFISHAKADLNQDESDPIHDTLKALPTLPIEHWFDAGKIVTSQDFEAAIRAGIRDCSILLAFYTDHYGARPWCRREVLDSKSMSVPILVVDALQDGEPRSFPYLGNIPTIRWHYREPAADARHVVDRAVREALRFKHNRAQLVRVAAAGECVLPAAPEAVTLAYAHPQPHEAKTFLYPDPPLGREELHVLTILRPHARFVTPLTKIAQWPRPAHIDVVAVSISASNDPERYGLSARHQRALADEIHLYLLLAGLRIAYGGALKGDFDTASNFTLALFELVRGYAKLADAVHASRFHPIVNHAPWPLRLEYGEAEWQLFGKEAEYCEGPRPAIPWTDDKIFPAGGAGWRFTPNTPEKRYAWARGLTAMRRQMIEQTQARVLIGGNLVMFLGVIPGVIEEAWWSLTHRQPLYLVGAFGGAARAVSDQSLAPQRPARTAPSSPR
jgi:SLOG cluster2/TIR domain